VRVVFMGTPDFAVPSLQAVSESHEIVSVFTRPDSVSGRGSQTVPSPIKAAAVDLGLRVSQPKTLRDASVQAELAAMTPEAIVVVAYGLILPREVLDVPALGCINVHASLLPRWRGAAPIHRAILAGDAETGVSVMRMEEGLDTGPYCVVETVALAEKTVTALSAELATVGARALVLALERIASGTCEWVEQDDANATYADKIEKQDVMLDPDLDVNAALRRIRVSSPQAPSRAVIAGKGVTVQTAHRSSESAPPGSVAPSRSGLLLGFCDGTVEIVTLKPDGKGSMAAADWARGLRLSSDAQWSGHQ